MNEQFQRTEMLLGEAAMQRLFGARTAVFGIGGVGGFVVEALVRAGIGAIDLIDNDSVSESNLNRQIIATKDTVGRAKTEVAQERILSINPDCRVTLFQTFVLPDTIQSFDFSVYDYIVDAIDTVSGKLAIIEKAKTEGIPVISCMGTGNKLNPGELQVSDLYETSVCPLAKVMRRECRKRGIDSLKVVWSPEEPRKPHHMKNGESGCGDSFPGSENASASEAVTEGQQGKRPVPGSVSFVPSAAGLLMASEVIKDLTAGLIP